MTSSDKPVNPEGRPLEVLFERQGLPRFDLPAPLVAAYGGGLGFESPRLIANFVSSVDGVVALDARGESGKIISGGSEADRFVMGLLRACADTVMIGAGTFRHASNDLFHAEAIYPPAAALFAETRRRLGLAARPQFVLVTGSGVIEAGPALENAIIVTTAVGEGLLRQRVPKTARVVAFPTIKLRLSQVVELLRNEGSRLLLTEGGPSLFAEVCAEGILDELFLTTSPSLFGRFPSDRRKSLADGVD